MSWGHAVAGLTALALFGCVSNPTPHPGQPDGGQTGGGGGTDAVAPAIGKGPDRDGDGVPDCEAIGGVWDDAGSRCHPPERPADGSDGGSDATEAGDGVVAGDAGDAGDAEDAEGDAPGDEGDGPSPGTARRD